MFADLREEVALLAKRRDDAKCSILVVYKTLLVGNDVWMVELRQQLQMAGGDQQRKLGIPPIHMAGACRIISLPRIPELLLGHLIGRPAHRGIC